MDDARQSRDWALTTVWAYSMDAVAAGLIFMVLNSDLDIVDKNVQQTARFLIKLRGNSTDFNLESDLLVKQ